MNHIDRMLDERSELIGRLSRLREFIEQNTLFAELDKTEQSLRITQSYLMHQYVDILNQRIDKAGLRATAKRS
jgi:hypothetical protein